MFSITEQQQQTQKQKVEQMILIGDKTVIHMWLPEESSVAITNEQFQQCQQLQLQRNRSNIHKETTDPNNSSIDPEFIFYIVSILTTYFPSGEISKQQ